jgi:hypothetical protein
MGDDFVEISDLDDAVIEDTVHCRMCGGAMRCGGDDCVITEQDDGSAGGGPVDQLVLCVWCAKAVHDRYREFCEESGVDP